MFCASCGAKAAEGQNFCNVCGQSVVASSAPVAEPQPASAARRGRVERHLYILVVLWIVWAVIRVLPGIGLLFLG
ncbi:MAG: hypothetical protein ACRD19_01855, partial [Terriglobia bacterium]